MTIQSRSVVSTVSKDSPLCYHMLHLLLAQNRVVKKTIQIRYWQQLCDWSVYTWTQSVNRSFVRWPTAPPPTTAPLLCSGSHCGWPVQSVLVAVNLWVSIGTFTDWLPATKRGGDGGGGRCNQPVIAGNSEFVHFGINSVCDCTVNYRLWSGCRTATLYSSGPALRRGAANGTLCCPSVAADSLLDTATSTHGGRSVCVDME